MTRLQYKKPYEKILAKLNSSRTYKIKSGSIDFKGVLFTQKDIFDIGLNADNNIVISTTGWTQSFRCKDLNLRETEHVIRWLKARKSEQ